MASSQDRKKPAAKGSQAGKRTTASGKTGTAKRSGSTSAGARKTSGSGTGRASSGKRTPAAKKGKPAVRRTASKAAAREQSGMYDEVKMLISLAAAIIMLISTLNFGGKVGGYIAYFLFGAFGWVAYAVPFLVFFGTAFIISNRHSHILFKKVLAFLLFSVSLMTLLQMLASPYDTITKITDYYKNCAVYKDGGGIVGGAVSHILTNLFGKIGCYVIAVIGLLVGIILIAQKAIFTNLLGRLRQYMAGASERREERRLLKEELAAAEEEDEALDEADDSSAPSEVYAAAEKLKKPKVYNQEIVRVQALDADSQNATYDALASDNTGAMQKETEEALVMEDVVSLPPDFKLAEVDIEDPAEPSQDIVVTHMEPIHFEEVESAGVPPTEAASGIGDRTMPIELPDGVSDGKAVSEDTLPDVKAPVKQTKEKLEAEPVTEEEIAPPVKEYVFPPLELLRPGARKNRTASDGHLKETAMKLQSTLDSFGVKVQVTNVSCGPAVTRYELTPEQGVKVSKIVALTDDIKLNLAVADIRIEAPIPGKSAVGIEVPNKENTMVAFRDLIESTEFNQSKSNVSFAVGRDISGQVIVTDIAKMPHLLIAGATGSGKSVCINTLIMSIIYKAKPEDVRLIMVDPKVVELSVYNGIPHLLIPVVTDPKKAAGALNWAVMEMTDRYNKFAELNVRDIKGYNQKIEKSGLESETYKKLPQIVIIVDELADLMMVAPGEVEDSICRLAQLARAAGLHLVIATQRPSVNVITGLIKANIPSRIAFAVSSGVDSRTIIDMNGAEKLMGKGDMLFYPAGMQKPLRVQGAFISDNEVMSVVEFLKAQGMTADYSDDVANKISSAKSMDSQEHGVERDVYFVEAGRFIIEKDKASIGMLQRVYKIGFNRAARIMDQLCEAGVVGPEEGTKPRKVLMSAEEFEQYIEDYV